MPVVDAVVRDLEDLGRRDPGLACSSYAAGLEALAARMDDPRTSATAMSNCLRELRETSDRLRDLAPKAEAKDDLDAARSRREARLAGGATSTD